MAAGRDISKLPDGKIKVVHSGNVGQSKRKWICDDVYELIDLLLSGVVYGAEEGSILHAQIKYVTERV